MISARLCLRRPWARADIRASHRAVRAVSPQKVQFACLCLTAMIQYMSKTDKIFSLASLPLCSFA